MGKIKGENVVVYTYLDGIWKPFVCGASCDLEVGTETIETSIKGQGYWRTFKGAAHSWTVNFEGIVSLMITNAQTLPDLRALQISMTPLLIRYQRRDDSGETYTDEGTAIIVNSQDSGPIDGMNVYTIQMKGSGPITQVFTPTIVNPPGSMRRYEYTSADGGEDYFEDPILSGKDIQVVTKDGIGNAKLILSGTPLNKEVLYTTATGRFTFAAPFAPGEVAVVNYQDI